MGQHKRFQYLSHPRAMKAYASLCKLNRAFTSHLNRIWNKRKAQISNLAIGPDKETSEHRIVIIFLLINLNMFWVLKRTIRIYGQKFSFSIPILMYY